MEEIARGKSLEHFEASRQMRWLVQRAIEIISEASRAIPGELTSTRPRFHGARFVASATFLRHDYEGLSDRIIWKRGSR